MIAHYLRLLILLDKRLDTILLRDEEILNLIRNLNSNKSAGADGISAQMLLICDSTILSPLKFISLTSLTLEFILICGK